MTKKEYLEKVDTYEEDLIKSTKEINEIDLKIEELRERRRSVVSKRGNYKRKIRKLVKDIIEDDNVYIKTGILGFDLALLEKEHIYINDFVKTKKIEILLEF